MDEKFLELWGNMLINAARGKRQSKDFFNWMQTGFQNFPGKSQDRTAQNGYPDLYAAFKQIYGLDSLPERSDDYKDLSEKALKDFKQSFKDYLTIMGVVSKEDHLALVEKYEKLKAKCKDQEESIKHLHMLLNAKGTAAATEMAAPFQDMIKKQGEVFQQMMKSFGQSTESSERSSEESSDKQKPEKKEKEDDQNDGSGSDR